MKKIIIATLLFSSMAFAQILQEPQCRDGKLYYMDQQHVFMDFCIVRLKAKSLMHCQQIFTELGQEGTNKEYAEYEKNRKKELCK